MTKRPPDIKIVAAVRRSYPDKWTEKDVYYFVINSLVYPCFQGYLHLNYPEFSTQNIGRFSPTIETLTDLSLVPKSIIEIVQKTSEEYEYILLDNQLEKLEQLLEILKFQPNFWHHYEDEVITFWTQSKYGKQIRGNNYYLERFGISDGNPEAGVLYYRDIWEVYLFSRPSSTWIYSENETEEFLKGESDAFNITNELARRILKNRNGKPFISRFCYNYEISFYLNGGEMKKNNPSMYKKEDTPIIFNNPIKYGYTFKGWHDNPECSGKRHLRIPKGGYGDRKFYAKWVANKYRIVFDVGGGDPLEPITFEYDTIPNLPTPTRNGYTFKGWYVDSECKREARFPSKLEDNPVMKSKFNPDAFAFEISLSFPTINAEDTKLCAKWSRERYKKQ